MPKYEITSPDGKRFEITAPDGATQEEVLAYAQSQGSPAPAQPPLRDGGYQPSLANTLKNPNAATGRALYGLGEAALTAATGIPATIAGGYGGMYNLVTGHGLDAAANTVRGVSSSGYQPTTPSGAAAVRVMGLPIEIPSRILGYGGGKLDEIISGEGGGARGFESAGEVLPALVGTFFGGRSALKQAKGVTVQDVKSKLIPDSIPIASKVKEAITDVWHARASNNAGHILLAEKHLKNLAKDATPNEVAQIVAGLESRGKSPIAGSPSTSADALARYNRGMELKGKPERVGANYVALEKGLATVPETSKVFTDVKLLQEQARANVMNKGAGTEKQMAAAIQARTDATSPLYKRVETSKAVVDALPVWHMTNNLIKKSPANADLVATLGKVRDSLGTDKGLLKSPQHLQSAIENINILLTKAENKPKVISSRLMMVKGMLEKQINKVEPAQGLATKTFAEKSIPINQMQLWQTMRNKFMRPTGKEAPGAFLGALRDEQKLIKEATGFKRGSDITDIFDAKQSSLAAKLAAEMEVGLTKARMASEVDLPGIGKPASGIEPRLPNMLIRETMIANFLLRHLSSDANVPVNIAAARILKDPKLLAATLKTVKPAHRTQILKTFRDVSLNKATVAGAAVTSQQQEQQGE